MERSTRCKRDYKREARGRFAARLAGELKQVLVALASDVVLDPRYRDHGLSGDWSGYRNCHIAPDLVLIYAKVGDTTLRLVRLGSHSEVFA